MAIRARVLRANPLCVHCDLRGRVEPATEVDHIVALSKGGTNAYSNLQGLCQACHVDKTVRDAGGRRKPVIGLDGWAVGDE